MERHRYYLNGLLTMTSRVAMISVAGIEVIVRDQRPILKTGPGLGDGQSAFAACSLQTGAAPQGEP